MKEKIELDPEVSLKTFLIDKVRKGELEIVPLSERLKEDEPSPLPRSKIYASEEEVRRMPNPSTWEN